MVLFSVFSTVYKIKLKYSVQYGMPLMYMRKINGPKIEPYGTPVDNVRMLDETPFISTYSLWPVR